MGRSDLVRRAMSKKKHKVMEEERHNFIFGIVDEKGIVQVSGCLRRGISEEAANKIFDQMMDFASYAFNKSHAAAYAVIAYQTAYLIRYYPTEYIAAMLNSVMGINEKVAFYTRFAKELDIQVSPPDINESFTKFTVLGNKKIRFGLAAIKNVGQNIIENIIKTREEKGSFTGLLDFCSKVDASGMNKRTLESLIKAGAFDSQNVYRSKLLAVYEKLLEGISNEKKRNISGQVSLFDISSSQDATFNQTKVSFPEIKEFDKRYLLIMEKEMTGLYLTGHPLDEYEDSLKLMTDTKISEIVEEEVLEETDGIEEINEVANINDNDRVVIGGIISEVTKKITRSSTMMAFVRLEDLFASIEVIIFPKIFEKFKEIINEDSMVVIKGRVSLKEDEKPKIICEEIKLLKKLNECSLYIQTLDLIALGEVRGSIKTLTSKYKGNMPIYLYAKKERKTFLLNEEYFINLNIDLFNTFQNIYGKENVKIM
jgi:DNA polymerase-3 subunit alpha